MDGCEMLMLNNRNVMNLDIHYSNTLFPPTNVCKQVFEAMKLTYLQTFVEKMISTGSKKGKSHRMMKINFNLLKEVGLKIQPLKFK